LRKTLRPRQQVRKKRLITCRGGDISSSDLPAYADQVFRNGESLPGTSQRGKDFLFGKEVKYLGYNEGTQE
jgi:hypothetical protein